MIALREAYQVVYEDMVRRRDLIDKAIPILEGLLALHEPGGTPVESLPATKQSDCISSPELSLAQAGMPQTESETTVQP